MLWTRLLINTPFPTGWPSKDLQKEMPYGWRPESYPFNPCHARDPPTREECPEHRATSSLGAYSFNTHQYLKTDPSCQPGMVFRYRQGSCFPLAGDRTFTDPWHLCQRNSWYQPRTEANQKCLQPVWDPQENYHRQLIIGLFSDMSRIFLCPWTALKMTTPPLIQT